MRIYFIRHGESEANVTQTFSNQNHELHPLTAKGRAQVQARAEQLRAVKFSEIYSSPMLRARQTAEILNAPHNVDIQISSALLEHDAGDFEGRADQEAWTVYSKLFETWIIKHDLDARIANGESFNDMRARFIPFFSDLTQRYADTEANVLLVGHAGIFHTMLPLLLANVGFQFGSQHLLRNAALVLVEQRQGELICLEWDEVKLDSSGAIRE